MSGWSATGQTKISTRVPWRPPTSPSAATGPAGLTPDDRAWHGRRDHVAEVTRQGRVLVCMKAKPGVAFELRNHLGIGLSPTLRLHHRSGQKPRKQDQQGILVICQRTGACLARGNTRCGHRVAAWVPGCRGERVRAAAARAGVRSVQAGRCRGSASSTVEKDPRKVQPYGSGDETEAAALARSRPNPHRGM